jgi:hypothetical protein
MIWDGWMSNDISLYSFCIRVPALSADLTNSKASKCSNAWNKNKKEKCDYRTIYLKSKFCCNLIFVLPVDTYGQLMWLGSLPVLSGIRVTQLGSLPVLSGIRVTQLGSPPVLSGVRVTQTLCIGL